MKIKALNMKNLLLPISIFVLLSIYIDIVESARFRRMINANLTKPNEIKYVVYVEALDDVGSPRQCNGGIIDKYYILTAANCVIDKTSNDFKSSRFRIIAGTNDLNSRSPKIERFVEKIMVPTAYNGSHWELTLDFTPVEANIAVLKLNEPLDLSNTAQLQSLELPTGDEKNPVDDSYLEGQTLQLASFGWNEIKEKYGEEDGMFKFYGYEGSSDGKLRKADVEIYDHEECDKENIRRVSSSYLCAKMVRRYMSEWRGVCKSDIGAPLVYNRKTIVGIVHSRMNNCNENHGPTQYTRVASFRGFIDDAMKGLTDDMRAKTAGGDGRF